MQNLIKALGLKQLALLFGGIVLLGSLSVQAQSLMNQQAQMQTIVAIAQAIEQGQTIPQARWNGGIVPYSWGGGHGSIPGPTTGTCSNYTGPSPCRADQTKGVDCSGFVRWVYSVAFGKDVLGSGGTTNQIALSALHQITAAAAAPGDLVYFGSANNPHHVGIYIGNGQMIDALHSGTNIETDHLLPDLAGYYHYEGILFGGSFSVVGLPTVSAAFIDQVLATNHSPAQGTGQLFYDYGLQYGIDPVYALAFFKHESSFGTTGIATKTLSIGNSICTSDTAADMRYYSNHHCFQKYHNWAESIESWYSMIRNGYVKLRNLVTIDQIIPVYAPSSDGNNVSGYIADIKRSVAIWRSGSINA